MILGELNLYRWLLHSMGASTTGKEKKMAQDSHSNGGRWEFKEVNRRKVQEVEQEPATKVKGRENFQKVALILK